MGITLLSFGFLILANVECGNPIDFNIGGVLSNDESISHFKEIITVSMTDMPQHNFNLNDKIWLPILVVPV